MKPHRAKLSRRGLLFGGATVVTGAGAGLVAEHLATAQVERIEEQARKAALAEAAELRGREAIPFYARHQAGVETEPQAFQTLIAVVLRDSAISPDELRRMLAMLTVTAARLTAGETGETDKEPELALLPARLTITFGFGRRLVRIVQPDGVPDWLDEIPPMQRDELRDEWSGGDLMFQIAADDPVTVAHAQRLLLKTAREFTTLRWVQPGFRRAYGVEASGTTQRNLMGQLDGTTNPGFRTQDFEDVVWSGKSENPAWLEGGTGFVLRRIEMSLDRWDNVDRNGREQAIGRRFGSGAPLTGENEHDVPDFEARNSHGFPVIGEFAHIRRARAVAPEERMYRRSYNYDAIPGSGSVSDSGLLFSAYQHDVGAQFIPVLRRLDELDLLNEWITHIGSAVFAIPAGCAEGEFIGQALFS